MEWGISFGSLGIPIPSILRIFVHELFGVQIGTIDSIDRNIMMNIRSAESDISGTSRAAWRYLEQLSRVIKNPLADPYTLGVSQGASVGAVATYFSVCSSLCSAVSRSLFQHDNSACDPMSRSLFAHLVHRGMSISSLILTGVIFSSFLGALISLMIALTGDDLKEIIRWLLGSVSMRGWRYIGLFLPFFLIGTFALMLMGRDLNVMTYGEEKAKLLGVHVKRSKYIVLLAGSILTGSAVAVSGTIGFVGLVIPHFIRLLAITDHRHLLPLSMLNGASFLVLADVLSRTIIEPTELPIGIITALIGAPVFGIILIRKYRGGTHL
ncbi:FecCD family ABC transporter permease [Bacillus sp. SL00103]